MKAKLRPLVHALVVASLLLVRFGPADAHHSFAADFDTMTPVTVTGVVTSIRWTNPHAQFYVDAKNPSGSVENWRFELGSVNMLVRYKFTKNTIKVGDTITVEGYRARDGSTFANAKTIKLPDGRIFSGGSSLGNVDTQ